MTRAAYTCRGWRRCRARRKLDQMGQCLSCCSVETSGNITVYKSWALRVHIPARTCYWSINDLVPCCQHRGLDGWQSRKRLYECVCFGKDGRAARTMLVDRERVSQQTVAGYALITRMHSDAEWTKGARLCVVQFMRHSGDVENSCIVM
jgi:hypothetical protein